MCNFNYTKPDLNTATDKTLSDIGESAVKLALVKKLAADVLPHIVTTSLFYASVGDVGEAFEKAFATGILIGLEMSDTTDMLQPEPEAVEEPELAAV